MDSYKLSSIEIEDSQMEISGLEERDLEALRKWLSENPHINARQDTLSLLYFLRGCKHDIERAKEKIRRFYLMRAERPEWFSDRDPFSPKVQELLELGVFFPLGVKDELNRHVFVIRTSAHDPKKYDLNDVAKVGKMVLDLALRIYPEISNDGLIAIFDMKGVSLRHAVQLNQTFVKRAVESWHIYPTKPKMLEFVNAPPHVNVGLNMFRLFMSAKMKSRVTVRGGTSTVKTTLPKELGGKGDSYKTLAKFWKEKLEQNADYFECDAIYKTLIVTNVK